MTIRRHVSFHHEHSSSRTWLTAVCAAVVLLTATLPAQSEDWPTYRHDIRRSGITSETIRVDALRERWRHESPGPPRTAWSGPAKWDAYANINGLRSMRNYDPAYSVIVTGDALYFGSSTEDSVYCVDAESGMEKWTYVAEGPVRIAPMYAGGKIYFGADDGFAYCLNAQDGSLVWKSNPAPDTPFIPSNGKLISMWPCRTGVLVDDGKAYFGCALLPWKEAYLCAVDASTGSPQGPGLFQMALERKTMEGALVASTSKLYVPQGRRPPMVFGREDGSFMGTFEGGGGAFVLLSPDSQLYHGPGNKTGWITASNAETRDQIASFDHGNCLIVGANKSYILYDDKLVAIDRGNRKALWSVPCDCPHSLILAGDTLFAGGDGKVSAFRASDGEAIWSQPVSGKAYELAVANGGLFASTHDGAIHAFRAN